LGKGKSEGREGKRGGKGRGREERKREREGSGFASLALGGIDAPVYRKNACMPRMQID